MKIILRQDFFLFELSFNRNEYDEQAVIKKIKEHDCTKIESFIDGAECVITFFHYMRNFKEGFDLLDCQKPHNPNG